MMATVNYLATTHVHVANRIGVAGEYPTIDQLVATAFAKQRVAGIKHDKVGTLANVDSTAVVTAGLGAAGNNRIEQVPACAAIKAAGELIA